MAFTMKSMPAAVASVAALSLAAIPATAAPLPQSGVLAGATAYDGSAEDAHNHYYYGRHRGVRTGDVIAGVLVLGTIAAVASAASNRNRERDTYRYPTRYPADDPRYRYRTNTRDPRGSGWQSGGMDRAVDMCVGQVERGRDRIGSVDSAVRDTSGWSVRGSLESGDYFSCRIDNEGRIRDVDIGDGYSYAPARDRDRDYSYAPQDDDRYAGQRQASNGQLSDEAYARARARTRAADPGPQDTVDYDAEIGDEPRPAYPGGPLPGEEGYNDGRYDIASQT